MMRQQWLGPGLLLALIGALLFAASCSGIVYVDDCVRVSPVYKTWKCKR